MFGREDKVGKQIKVTIFDEQAKEKYRPDEIEGYYDGEKLYLSLLFPKQVKVRRRFFVPLMVEGALNIFRYSFVVSNGRTTTVMDDYILEKEGIWLRIGGTSTATR